MTWNLEQGWTPHPEGKTGCSAQPPQKNNILSLPHSMLKTVGHWRDKNDTWVTWRGEKIHIFINRLQININHLILQQAFIAFYIFYFHAVLPRPPHRFVLIPCPAPSISDLEADENSNQSGCVTLVGQFGTKIEKTDNLAPRRQTDNLPPR